jgi:hypothetical protein
MPFGTKKGGGPPPLESDLPPPPTPTPSPTDELEALSDAHDEPILADSASDQLLSTSVPDGLSNSYGLAQDDSGMGSQSFDPYTGTAGDGGSAYSYTGVQNCDPYTGLSANSGGASDQTDADGGGDAGDDQTTGSAGDHVGSPGSTIPMQLVPNVIRTSEVIIVGTPPGGAARSPADGTETSPEAIPPTPPAPEAVAQPSPPTPPAPVVPPSVSLPLPQRGPGSAPYDPMADSPFARWLLYGNTPSGTNTPPRPAPSSWDTIIGDLLAGVGGMFGPSSVGPSFRPQTPAGLGPGLQQMGQLNSRMAQQSLRAASDRARGGALVVEAAYATSGAALTALAALPAAGTGAVVGSAPAAPEAYLGATLRSAGQGTARLLANTEGATELSGSLLKAAPIGIGFGVAANTVLAADPGLPEQIAAESAVLGPQLESALAPEASQLSNLGQRLPTINTAQTAVTNVFGAAQNLGRQLAQNYSRGMAFQDRVTSFLGPSLKNTTNMLGQTISGALKGTVPDIYRGALAPIADIKDVLRLTFTRQLQAQANLAEMTGTSFNIITSVRIMSVSRPLADAIRNSGGFIFRIDPSEGGISDVWDATIGAKGAWVPFFGR